MTQILNRKNKKIKQSIVGLLLKRKKIQHQLMWVHIRKPYALDAVVDFTGFLQVNHQVASSQLASSSCIKSSKIKLDIT